MEGPESGQGGGGGWEEEGESPTVTGSKALALGLSKSIGEKRREKNSWDAGCWVIGRGAAFSTGS